MTPRSFSAGSRVRCRSARGVLGIATCDKGLPAMMMAVAGLRDLPGVIVPGGVTLPPAGSEDAGTVQTLGTRFAHGMVSLSEAAELGCRACASPGGGCQFLGTAATSQVVGEALGLSVPHSALAPSGQPVWLDLARRSARALFHLDQQDNFHARYFDRREHRKCDGRSRGVRRFNEPAPAHSRNRPCRRIETADGWRIGFP